MIFHEIAAAEQSFGPSPKGRKPGAEYRISVMRMSFALGFFLILVLAAFAGQWLGWQQAADVFMHLVQVTAGGLVGLFIGERSALNSVRKG